MSLPLLTIKKEKYLMRRRNLFPIILFNLNLLNQNVIVVENSHHFFYIVLFSLIS